MIICQKAKMANRSPRERERSAKMAPIANNAKRPVVLYTVPSQRKIAFHVDGFSFCSGEDKSVNVMFPSNKKYEPHWKISSPDAKGWKHFYGYELSDDYGVTVDFIFGNKQGDPGLLPMFDDKGNICGYRFRYGSLGHVQLKYGDFFTVTHTVNGTTIATTDESCFFLMVDGGVDNFYVFQKGASLTVGNVLYLREFGCRIPGKEDIYFRKVESYPNRGEIRMQKFVGDKYAGLVSVKGSSNSLLLPEVVPGKHCLLL